MSFFHGGRNVALVDGCRIPFLRANTDYKNLAAYDLGRLAIKAILDKTQIDPNVIDSIHMGTVISNLETSNVARESALGAGIQEDVPAFTVSQACISANRAITSGADLISSGQADVVIAGGTESMSDIPIKFRKKFRQKLIESQKYRSVTDYLKFLKGLHFSDLLPEIPAIAEFSTQKTMGQDCDILAARLGVTRKEQDEYAVRSHKLAAKAAEEGLFDSEIELIMLPPDFEIINKDNGVRGDSTLEKLQTLRPAFMKPYGTLTAGNSSFLTDGAAAVLLMSEKKAKALGYRAKALIQAYTYSAQDPRLELLLGPAYSISKILDMTAMSLSDFDVFEFHEAFAAQVLANLKMLNSVQFAKEKLGKSSKIGNIPLDKLNTMGGSLSIGHPFGATGARLLTTAANRLIQEDATYALIASCAAGGLGNAIVLERYQ
jgi:acetyl-CoA acetyltransferase family protein